MTRRLLRLQTKIMSNQAKQKRAAVTISTVRSRDACRFFGYNRNGDPPRKRYVTLRQNPPLRIPCFAEAASGQAAPISAAKLADRGLGCAALTLRSAGRYAPPDD